MIYLPFRCHLLCSEYLLWLRYGLMEITATEVNVQLSLGFEVYHKCCHYKCFDIKTLVMISL